MLCDHPIDYDLVGQRILEPERSRSIEGIGIGRSPSLGLLERRGRDVIGRVSIEPEQNRSKVLRQRLNCGNRQCRGSLMMAMCGQARKNQENIPVMLLLHQGCDFGRND